jgi:glycosyltransferase involved in cell wall biosynthesis
MAAGNAHPIFVVVTDTYINPGQTGIQTLVRGLIAGLVQLKQNFHLVEWKPEKQGLFRLRPTINARLGKPDERKFLPVKVLLQPKNWRLVREAKARNYRIPIHLHPEHRDSIEQTWLLIPELMYLGDAARIIDHARQARLRVAAIFHDAIPISHPHLVRPSAVNDHADYMRALTRADAVLAVSRESAGAFIQFAMDNGLPHQQVSICCEPAEILGAKRVTEPQSCDPGAINLLCVSTLEPRKNHTVLIEAFEDFLTAFPKVNAFLHLVGASYGAAPEIAESVSAATRRNPRILWHGKMSQADLMKCYRLMDFTVYPSFLEGFGLPVVESLWLGKPCVCADFGAVAESASAGGCLMVDVHDRHALSNAIASMSTRPELRQSLTRQATTRPLKTWRDYAADIQKVLSDTEQGQEALDRIRKA